MIVEKQEPAARANFDSIVFHSWKKLDWKVIFDWKKNFIKARQEKGQRWCRGGTVHNVEPNSATLEKIQSVEDISKEGLVWTNCIGTSYYLGTEKCNRAQKQRNICWSFYVLLRCFEHVKISFDCSSCSKAVIQPFKLRVSICFRHLHFAYLSAAKCIYRFLNLTYPKESLQKGHKLEDASSLHLIGNPKIGMEKP